MWLISCWVAVVGEVYIVFFEGSGECGELKGAERRQGQMGIRDGDRAVKRIREGSWSAIE